MDTTNHSGRRSGLLGIIRGRDIAAAARVADASILLRRAATGPPAHESNLLQDDRPPVHPYREAPPASPQSTAANTRPTPSAPPARRRRLVGFGDGNEACYNATTATWKKPIGSLWERRL